MSLWPYLERKPRSERYAHLLGIVLMCLSALGWAIMERGWRVPPEYLPYQLVWGRYGAHLLFMLALLGRREHLAVVRTPRLGVHVFRSLLMFGMPVLFIMAVKKGINSDFIWSITWISVPITMATAFWWLRERAGPVLWMGALVGLVGAWMVLGSPLPRSANELLLPMGVALTYGIYVTLTRSLRTEPISSNLVHTALWVFILLSLILPFVWLPMSWPLAITMAGIGLQGLVMLLLLDRALACAPAAIVAPFIYTEVIWGFANEWLRHGVVPETGQVVGVALLAAMCIGIVSWVWFFSPATTDARIATQPDRSD